jgi:hypothetical protein
MFAGTDTTSYVISRCMIFLAKHPQWLTAIAEEQKRLIAEHGTAMDRKVCMLLYGQFVPFSVLCIWLLFSLNSMESCFGPANCACLKSVKSV